MVKYLTQDITTVQMGIIAHGCNCSGGFGSGVAGAIRRKWPNVYDAFAKLPTGKTLLGTAHLVPITDDDTLFVANCFTQVFYGRNGRFADVDAVDRCLRQVCKWGDYYNLPVYIPKIGAGLGGLDWSTEVLPVVQKCEEEFNTTITVCVVD